MLAGPDGKERTAPVAASTTTTSCTATCFTEEPTAKATLPRSTHAGSVRATTAATRGVEGHAVSSHLSSAGSN